jgi:hypothetical protein
MRGIVLTTACAFVFLSASESQAQLFHRPHHAGGVVYVVPQYVVPVVVSAPGQKACLLCD